MHHLYYIVKMQRLWKADSCHPLLSAHVQAEDEQFERLRLQHLVNHRPRDPEFRQILIVQHPG